MNYRSIQSEFYGDNVRWFIGVVEQILNDDLKLGRVKVRIFGVHSANNNDVDKKDLPWANVLLDVSQGGVGGSTQPTGIQVGARVFGFFLDGPQSQMPLVLGSIPHNNDYRVDTSVPVDQNSPGGPAERSFYRAGDVITDSVVEELAAAGVDRGFVKSGQTITQEQANLLNGSQPQSNSPISLIGASRQEQAFNFMKQYFISQRSSDPGIHAAAFIGNFINEAGANLPPNAGPDYKGIKGTVTRWGAEKSFGIAQWNLAAGRMGKLETYVGKLRNPPTIWADFAAQLEFVVWELENTHSNVLTGVKKTSTIRAATNVVMRYYETPEVAVNYNRYQRNRKQFSATRQSEIVRAFEDELGERVSAAQGVFDAYGG